MNEPLRGFLLILAAGVLCAVLGGLFGAGIAALSPELVAELFGSKAASGPARYAGAVGAIWGLFIGAGAMAFVIGAAAVSHWFRPATKDGPR